MQLTRNNRLITKKIYQYIIPAVFIALSNSLSAIVDGIFVGNMLGANELAAVNICSPFFPIFNTFATLIGIGVENSISVAKGRGQRRKANRLFTLGTIMTISSGFIFTIIYLICGKQIMHFLTTPDVYEYAISYFRIICLGAPLFVTVNGFSLILMTEGLEKYSTAIVLVANIGNAILDYFLIPRMGTTGAAVAAIIGFSVAIPMVLGYFLSKKRTFKFMMPKWKYIGEILRIGLPGALGIGLIAVKTIFVNKLVVVVAGTTGLIAASLCFASLEFFRMGFQGISQGTIPVLGMYYGERDMTGVRAIFKKALGIVFVAIIIFLAILEAFPQIVAFAYGVTNYPNMDVLLTSIRIFVLSFPGIALSFLLVTYYSATESPKRALFVALVEGIVAIVPTSLVLMAIWKLYGIWIAFAIAEIAAPIIIVLYSKGDIQNIYHIDDEPAVFEFSIDGTQNVSSFVPKVIEKIREIRPEKEANIIGVAIEEMVVHVTESNDNNVIIDIVIKEFSNGLMLSFSDNGIPFDPVNYSPDSEESQWDNLSILKAISSSMKYHYAIGLNKTIVFFDKHEEPAK